MAPPSLHLFLLLLSAFLLLPSSSSSHSSYSTTIKVLSGRRVLLSEESGKIIQTVKKKPSTTPAALGTTLSSSSLSSTKKNKNNTKLIKPSNSTKLLQKPILKIKLNSTSKPLNHTKPTSKTTNSTSKKPSYLTKPDSKTTNSTSKQSNSTKPTSKTTNSTKPTSKTASLTKPTSISTQKSSDPNKKNKPITEKKQVKKPVKPVGDDDEDDDQNDLVSEFRDLPARFQETLLPDLEVLSTTSKAYLNKANKQISKGFNPIVGKKFAPTVASIISFAFILIPFLLVSLIFNRIKAFFSLQKLVIFIQIYLSIYFSILCLSSLVTGLEPLKFFYATSQSTYICIQLLQTLAYVLYLLVLLMYLVLVFSTESGMVSKLLSLGQTFVGFAVGLHYYVTVFHRAVLRQAPKTSWRVHAVYATCFLLICLLGTAERRKKAYVVDGSEEGKKS